MPVLIIANIKVDNPANLQAYQGLAAASMKEFGIGFVGKAAPVPVLEGTPAAPITVVLEAESEEQARAWHSSEMYAKAIAARTEDAKFNIIVVPRVE